MNNTRLPIHVKFSYRLYCLRLSSLASKRFSTRLLSWHPAHVAVSAKLRAQLVTTLAATEPCFFPSLGHLAIKDAGFRDINLVALAPSFGPKGSLHELETLNLDSNPITKCALESFTLFAMDMPNLETLCMLRLSITRDDMLRFAKTVKDKAHWPHIASVYLTGRGVEGVGRATVLLDRAVQVVQTRARLDQKIEEAMANPNAASDSSQDSSDSDDS